MKKLITPFKCKKNLHLISIGIKKSCLILCLLITTTIVGFAQTKKLGSVDDFKNQLSYSKTQRGAEPQIQTSDAAYPAVLNKSYKVDHVETLVGNIKGIIGSHFMFTIIDGKLEGILLIPALEKAYRFYTDVNGMVQVEVTDIHSLICTGFSTYPESSSSRTDAVQAVPPATSSIYHLQSLAGATAVAYLDFDGEVSTTTYWNGGNTIDAQPGNFTETDITNIFNLVSEDYRAFKLNITTDLAVFNAAPVNKRMRCIFTPTNTAAPGSGGVAYLKSFSWNNDTPCWVFNSGAKGAGEAASHELGHTFGLSHDGRTTPAENYYSGAGIWAPIMGVGYSKSLVQWSKGEYPNANKTEDDVAIISNATNGFGYKTDEDGGTPATAKALAIGATGAVTAAQNYGIITIRTDVDVYSFTTSGGAVTLTATPAPTYADLDIILTLTNASGTVVSTANPTAAASGSQSGTNPLTGLAATISTTLTAGTYYLQVDGTGQGDLTTGYSDYASIGEYRISGTVPVSTTNQPPVVSITAPANGGNFTAPANITISANATDDGSVAKVDFYNGTTLLGSDATSPYSFTWTNVAAGSYTINAIATDNLGSVSTTANVAVTVSNVNQAPVVTITSPANNASFVAPASITINASATDDGSVAKVDFYNGTTLLGSDTTSPYSFTWTNVAAGNYTIRTIAIDNLGLASAAASVAVIVTNTSTPPIVAITSPANNATFTAPASISITATASDDGTVTKVEFYNGAIFLGSDTTNPYTFTWTNVTAGTYTINAKATDNSGNSSIAAVTVTVITPPATVVTVYKDCNYSTTGYAIPLGVENYTLTQLRALGVVNDDISSLRVQSGYEIVLYRDDNFLGNALIVRSDVSCLVSNNFNDAASSARVRLSTAAAAAESQTKSISAFPNPADQWITISLNNTEQTIVTLTIIDSYGNAAGSIHASDGQQINVSHLPTGIYSLRAIDGQDLLITKIIVR
ncbi:MAG: T9SS type A sorting domain-containing protein [Cytophagaceae bacterium]|nr:T9SS type A sorting domain-containing protein [Cytophagaceae bacterium]